MKRTIPLFIAAAVAMAPAVAFAGKLQPGNVPIVVSCGFKYKVEDTKSMLELELTDPILNVPCEGNGMTIINSGKGRNDRGFTIDCRGDTFAREIRGATKGKGVDARGPNMVVQGCYTDGFLVGISTNGLNAEINDSRARHAVKDGVVIKANGALSLGEGAFLNGVTSDSNGGWGIVVQGNYLGVDSGGVATTINLVSNNGKGGILLQGRYNDLANAAVFNNRGPGLVSVNNSCCYPNTIDAVNAFNNDGPGVIFVGRDDGFTTDPVSNVPLPIGFPNFAGSISGFGNGTCPDNTVPGAVVPQGICPVIKGGVCGDAALNACIF